MKKDNLKDLQATEKIAVETIHDLLNSQVEELSTDICQKLTNARFQALAVAEARLQSAPRLAGPAGILSHQMGDYFAQHRLMATSMFLISALAVALFVNQHLTNQTQLENSDAFLLAAELPPEAFADKGFNAWVASSVK